MTRVRRTLHVETYEIGPRDLAKSLGIEAPGGAALSLEVIGLNLILKVTTSKHTDCKPGDQG